MAHLLIFAFLLLLVLMVSAEYLKQRSRLPPGPPGLPILGNILQLPRVFLHMKLHSWSNEYGPFFSFWIMGQPFVVLGNIEVASQVLDRMSSITSDRPPFIKITEFYCSDSMLTSQDNTPIWKAQRRVIHCKFNVRATTGFCPMQESEAAQLVLDLGQHAEIPFPLQVHRFAASVIMRCLYGGNTISLFGPDPSKRIQQLTDDFTRATSPRHSIVDTFPLLKPIIQRSKLLRRKADLWNKDAYQTASTLYAGAASTLPSGAETFVHELKSNGTKYGVTSEQGLWLAFTIFAAGQDTTNTALLVFILAMLHHPIVAKAAQHELDVVCGDEPPSFEVKNRLPYIQAIVKETFRWRPNVPLSIPHRACEDFEYSGYVVPKGTIILDNIWSETRDPAIYDDPETFDPAHFLDASGNLVHGKRDGRADHIVFGRGRRTCPGREFAYNSMFIACAYLLWAYRFEWTKDKQGREMAGGKGMDDFFDNGTTMWPKPFGVVCVARKEGLQERLVVNRSAM